MLAIAYQLAEHEGPLVGDRVMLWEYSGRRHRLRNVPGRLGYSLLRGGDEGMTPAELRTLPIVIHERHHHHSYENPHELVVRIRILFLGSLWSKASASFPWRTSVVH